MIALREGLVRQFQIRLISVGFLSDQSLIFILIQKRLPIHQILILLPVGAQS